MNERDWHHPAIAEQWDRDHLAGNPTRAEHLELLVDWLDQLQVGEVLDVGCGSGIVAEMVLERLPASSLAGLDASPAMLSLGRRRLERFGVRARLEEIDLAGTALPDWHEAFDAAIAVQALHHLEAERLRLLLRWLQGALKPGGWLLIVDRIGVPGAALYPVFRRYKERAGHARNPESWEAYADELGRSQDRPQPLDAYLAMLQRAGFEAGCLDCRADRALLVARAATMVSGPR